MTLEELCSFIDENKDVYVYSCWGQLLAVYDGRNSIPTRYNKREVLQISCRGESIIIYID